MLLPVPAFPGNAGVAMVCQCHYRREETVMEHQKEGFSGLSAVCDQEEMKNTHLGIPEVTDCSSDTIPAGTESTAGTKKVQVPDLVSMWKYLLNKNYANRRLSFYSNLNNMLKSGELSRIVGFKVLNRVINKEAMKLVNVDLWKINRTSFYADIHVELTLQSGHGSRTWNGILNCLCSFEENKKFLCDILSLTDKAWQDYDKGRVRLNPFLVPYYTNSQMDQIAEQIWKEYGMKEALTDPTKRNAIELAKRMGLSIEYYNVYEHQGVKSILFFTDCELIVGEDRMERQKDGSNKHIKDAHGEKVMIRANTIVINTNKVRKPYSTFAVFHECIHYYLHYMFFRLQEMGSNDVRNVKTVEIEIDEDKEYSDPIYFMEKQADRGAYGLILPATHTKSIIADNIGKAAGCQNEGELFEIVGSRIAEDQGLADFRIRARMIQLGHIEAKGALNYVSRERIQPFAFNPDAWKENELSYVVDPWTVERLQKENKDFQAFMISGDYVYADGHVVLNDPKFVEEKGGRLFLTNEARKQVDACCLRFTRQYVQKNIGLYVYGRMFYDPEYVAQTKFYLSDMINERHLDELDARIAYRDEFPRTFVGAFDMLMKKNGQTRESVAPLLHTTERSLHDWLYNPDRKITRDFIVYITLMWKVPDWISSLLLKTAGLTMNEYDRRHQALEYVRTVLWDQGIEKGNKYMTSKGLEPLSV